MSRISARYASRLTKLRRLVKKAGADALLVTKPQNVTYLSGFTGEDSWLLVSADHQTLLSDFRFATQLDEECPGFDLEIRETAVGLADLAGRVAGRRRSTRVAVEAAALTVAEFESLGQAMEGVDLEPTRDLVETLRVVKDRQEINEIRRAVRIAQRAFGVIRAQLQATQSEREIAAEIEYRIRRFGGGGCSFPPIVAVGPRAALPHAIPTEGRIAESDFVLIDWGATAGGYASDLTRVLVTGKISPKLERVYGVVLKAQLAAIAAIRPGALMSDIDAAARQVIAKAGYAKRFGHSLGHGIGLEIHEAPRLAMRQDRPLKAGMVVTVEPGIYLPNWGGVRIEDDVLVTRDGHEVLSDVPKDLADCVVA